MPGMGRDGAGTGMKGKARSPHSRAARPPLERMLRIHQAIQAGNHPNASSLAREMEVSAKSIHRDLEFMRDRLDLPLEYEAAHGGYHCHTEAVAGLSHARQITEGELFALLVAEKAAAQQVLAARILRSRC